MVEQLSADETKRGWDWIQFLVIAEETPENRLWEWNVAQYNHTDSGCSG